MGSARSLAASPSSPHFSRGQCARAWSRSRVSTRGLGLGLWLLALLPLACGGPRTSATPVVAPVHPGVLHFYPLDPGWHWSFALQQTLGEGELAQGRILTVSKVDTFDGKRAIVRMGAESTVLEVSAAGLQRQPSGTFLLRFPVVEGATWSGASSTVKVADTHARAVTEAGTFTDCVETIETFSGDEPREVRTTYCPEVGPVLLSVHAMGNTGPVMLTARLRSFGPSLDLGSAGAGEPASKGPAKASAAP